MSSKKEDIKQYQKLIDNLINSKISKNSINNILNSSSNTEILAYFKKNTKKSSFFGQILPSVLFLIIFLVSFSLDKIIQNIPNFGFITNNENLKICILLFGCLFGVLGIVLLVQKYILKVKVIYISKGRYKGYKNIKNNEYNNIVNLISKQ